jgi:uncharacterized protein
MKNLMKNLQKVKNCTGLLTILLFLIMIFLPGSCSRNTGEANSNAQIAERSPQLLPIPSWLGNEPLIIDANAGLGRFANGSGSDFIQTEKVINHLRSAGISKAVVYSVLSRETDAEEGDAIVIEACKNHLELMPGYVITPFEMDVDTAISIMNKNNIRIARLFPVVGHFSVYPSIIGPVVEKLQKANKILFIDFEANHWSSDAINYDAVYQLCKAYPEIPVVLIGPTITGTRNYPNMLKECNNLYLEISQMIQPEGIFHLVKNGFGKRLIFGSDFPLREPASMLNMLAYSGLSKEELQDICSGNLLRILNISYNNNSFSLKTPLKRDIVDLHVHQGQINPVPSGTGTADGIIRNMERCGIKAAILTSVWSCFGEVKRGNKAVSEACTKYPGRLFGYITLDPKYPEEVISELNLYGNNPAFRGIKLHALHGVDISDPRHNIIFSFADKKGWFLLCHASGDPVKWEKICNTYKNAKFIVAHQGASDPVNVNSLKLAELAGKCKNLYLDCASSGMTPGALERLAAAAGAEQLTYGSDYPMFDFSYETGRVISSSLTEEEKNLILYGNAKKLMGL